MTVWQPDPACSNELVPDCTSFTQDSPADTAVQKPLKRLSQFPYSSAVDVLLMFSFLICVGMRKYKIV